jgi:hypothetical protein
MSKLHGMFHSVTAEDDDSLDRTGADVPGKMETLIADRQLRTPDARDRRR